MKILVDIKPQCDVLGKKRKKIRSYTVLSYTEL